MTAAYWFLPPEYDGDAPPPASPDRALRDDAPALPDASAPDAHLMAQIRAGDMAAFEQLFRAQYTALHRYATSLTRNAAIAEELVADVFTSLWEQRSTWTAHETIRASLFATVRHRVLHWHRRQRVEARHATRLASELAMDVMVGVPADQAAEWHDVVRVVRAAIQALPPRTREAYVLHRQDTLTYAEIARVMGTSPKTVEKQISAALRALREALQTVRT